MQSSGLNIDLGQSEHYHFHHKETCQESFLYRFGFSEFNSDTYAPIAFKGIAAIVGLSDYPELKKIAEMVMNLQLFDHIIGSKGERCNNFGISKNIHTAILYFCDN